jgi:hypothetical protein
MVPPSKENFQRESIFVDAMFEISSMATKNATRISK